MSCGVSARSKTMRYSMSGMLAGALELFQNDAAIRGQHFLPVVMRAQIRRVDEHVERFAAGGRGGGFGAGGRREIAGRVGRGLALLVDPVELLVRVAAEDEVVMREMLVAFVQAEIEHDAGAGGLVAAAAARTLRRSRR